jgi:hypothetical protein
MRQREGRGNDFLGFAGHVSATPNRGGWWHAVGQIEGTGCPGLAFEPVEAATPLAGEEPAYLPPPANLLLSTRLRRRRPHYWRRLRRDWPNLRLEQRTLVPVYRTLDAVVRFIIDRWQQANDDVGSARYQRIPDAGRRHNRLPDLEAMVRHGGLYRMAPQRRQCVLPYLPFRVRDHPVAQQVT